MIVGIDKYPVGEFASERLLNMRKDDSLVCVDMSVRLVTVGANGVQPVQLWTLYWRPLRKTMIRMV